MQSLYLVIFFLVIFFNSFSQQWEWSTKPYGKNINSRGVQVCADNSGNSYVKGFSDGFIVFGSATLAPGNFVVKYSPSGMVIWAKNVSSGQMDLPIPSYCRPNRILTDQSGNVFIAGTYTGNLATTTTTLTSHGDRDFYLLKLNSSGNEQWAKSFGGSRGDFMNDFIVDKNGNSYLTGWSSSDSLLFGNDTLIHSAPYEQFYLARINSMGQTSWVTSGLQTSDSLFYGDGYFLALEKNQNIVVIGEGANGPGIEGASYFCAKFDSLGNISSNNFIFHSYLYNLYSFAMDDSSNFYTTSDGGNHPGLGTLIKYDSLWNIKWGFGIGDEYVCYALGNVKIDGAGNSYLSGSLRYDPPFSGCTNTVNVVNVFGEDLTVKGSDDILIAKIGAGGKLLWLKTAGGKGSDLLSDMYVTKAGECYLTGAYIGAAAYFDIDSLASDGTFSQCFAAKLGASVVGLKEIKQKDKNGIFLFPNPVNNILKIRGESIKGLRICNSVGTMIKELGTANDEFEIDWAKEPKGLYIIEIFTDKGTFAKKIIVE